MMPLAPKSRAAREKKQGLIIYWGFIYMAPQNEGRFKARRNLSPPPRAAAERNQVF